MNNITINTGETVPATDGQFALPEGGVWNSDNTVTYTLAQQVTLGDRVLQELVFHPLKAGALIDMLDSASGEGSRTLFLLRQSTGLTDPLSEKLLRNLEIQDFQNAAQIASGFFTSGRRSGTSISPQ